MEDWFYDEKLAALRRGGHSELDFCLNRDGVLFKNRHQVGRCSLDIFYVLNLKTITKISQANLQV